MENITKKILTSAEFNTKYIIKSIDTNNKEIEDFLFSLGCYEGEYITVISKISDALVVTLKDARYSLNKELASCIFV
ncbi:MAG: ferrous iron transport protein A [Lachnospirales bacterium]